MQGNSHDNTYTLCPPTFHTYAPEPPESEDEEQVNVTDVPSIS